MYFVRLYISMCEISAMFAISFIFVSLCCAHCTPFQRYTPLFLLHVRPPPLSMQRSVRRNTVARGTKIATGWKWRKPRATRQSIQVRVRVSAPFLCILILIDIRFVLPSSELASCSLFPSRPRLNSTAKYRRTERDRQEERTTRINS